MIVTLSLKLFMVMNMEYCKLKKSPKIQYNFFFIDFIEWLKKQ